MKTIADFFREYNLQMEQKQRASEVVYAPPVVFSREVASGAQGIAQQVADRLGFQLWDRKILDQVLSVGHVKLCNAEQFDEKRPGLLQTIGMQMLDPDGAIFPGDFDLLLKRSVLALLKAGNVVVLGRGASFLAEPGKALRVRLHAPIEKRVVNWMMRNKLTIQKASVDLQHRDAERAAFIKRFCGKCENDARWYDIALNTGEIPAGLCVDLIVELYEKRFRHATTSQSSAPAAEVGEPVHK